MNRKLIIFVNFALLALTALSCVSGGRFVNSGESLQVLIACEAKGIAPTNVRWYLIRTKNGLAILEKDSDKGSSDTVIDKGWQDRRGHHFVIWAQFLDAQSMAFEFIVPDDITKPALRHVYPAGTYAVIESNGLYRPVPHMPPRVPATRLIPILQKGISP